MDVHEVALVLGLGLGWGWFLLREIRELAYMRGVKKGAEDLTEVLKRELPEDLRRIVAAEVSRQLEERETHYVH